MTLLVKYWHRHFLGLEFCLASIPAILIAIWIMGFDGSSHIDNFMREVRSNIYRSIATISGTLLGFSIAAVSIVINFASSERLRLLRESGVYSKIWKAFFQATKILGSLTIVALVCLTWDRDDAPLSWLAIPISLLICLSIARVIRVIWMLEQIVKILTKPSSKT